MKKVRNNLLKRNFKWLGQGPRQHVLIYPSYIINGCHYHVKDRGDTCINQNSGISIEASTIQNASAKYKNLVLGDMCFNGVAIEI